MVDVFPAKTVRCSDFVFWKTVVINQTLENRLGLALQLIIQYGAK